MSIASEYARQISLRDPPTPALRFVFWHGAAALVTKRGRLKVSREEMDPNEALKLAAWIQETFGEEIAT